MTGAPSPDQPTTTKQVVQKVGKEKLIGWIFGGAFWIIGLALAAMFTPVISATAALLEVPERLDVIEKQFEVLADEVRAGRLPQQFTILSPANTGPIKGYCVEGDPCDLVVKIRRAEEATGCRFSPGSGRYGFWDRREDAPSYAKVIVPFPDRNLPGTWVTMPLTVQTPMNLAPVSDFFIEADYLGCPGQGQKPHPGRSNLVPIIIKDTAP